MSSLDTPFGVFRVDETIMICDYFLLSKYCDGLGQLIDLRILLRYFFHEGRILCK